MVDYDEFCDDTEAPRIKIFENLPNLISSSESDSDKGNKLIYLYQFNK